jgi:hypothetical protein
VDRADRKHFLEPEPREFIQVLFREARVHLVDRHHHGLAAGPQFLRNLTVQRHDTFLHVDHQNNRARRVNGDFDLRQRGLDDDIFGFFAAQQADAAGVYEREGFSVPLGLDADAVARDAGLVMDDGNAPLDDAVEQRGFPDIGPADDGDES